VDLGLLKNILNIVEDRRIDHYVFTTCPGYEGYYKALYDKYFNSKIIDKALLSDEHRDETVDSYMFRVCNFINPNRDLDALAGLREIWNVFGLGNISRLKTSEDALDVSIEIYNIIMKYVDQNQGEGEGEGDGGEGQEGQEGQEGSEGGSQGSDQGDDKKSSKSQGKSQGGSDDGSGSETSDDGDGENDGSSDQGSASTSTAKGNKKGGSKGNGELSDRQKKQLANAIKKQKEFLDGEIKKTKMKKGDKQKMDQLTKAGVESSEVGEGGFQDNRYYGGANNKTVPAMVVKNFTKGLIDNSLFPQLARKSYNGEGVVSQEVIDQGLQMGTMLGKKMRTRQENNQLETTRLKSGKIDKRLLSGVGYGVTEVFKKVEQQNFKPAYIHISIDASGSMSGDKWKNSLKVAIAVAKASSMIQGLHCVISTRGDNENGPVTLIAYDSKKDKIGKIKQLFKYLNYDSTTPEGLSFESILKYIEETNNGQDSYFINISDGAPYFRNRGNMEYYGSVAEKHTKKQVEAMRVKGVKVLSYFVTGGYGSYEDAFKRMYGKDAETINMKNVTQIAKTMNGLLMKK
jgi:hypothetical protein